MTDRPAAIVAQVVDVQNDRQHKGFIKVTAHIPVEDGPLLTAALGWPTYTTPTPVAIAVLDTQAIRQQQQEVANTETAESSPSPSQTPPAGGTPNKRTQLAGMMCKDPLFQKYIISIGVKDGPFDTVEFIHNYLGVPSRKDIQEGTIVARMFDNLYNSFRLWRDAPELQES